MMAEHEPDAVELVMRYAISLGLHGVLILSPECDGCGECHDFSLLSDMQPGETERLIERYCDVTRQTEGRILPDVKVN